ncbi:hypothetical protein NPIL_91011 [Nephila pilipes]|uniref:Uncharacterized protein n=1 Tax=Nephila pilipes TaxID=299642 RepID=A0A8X6NYP3_NEPPI|nr:hypothetical protein NPIL_91011 [Nephila pilipes]
MDRFSSAEMEGKGDDLSGWSNDDRKRKLWETSEIPRSSIKRLKTNVLTVTATVSNCNPITDFCLYHLNRFHNFGIRKRNLLDEMVFFPPVFINKMVFAD